MAIKIIDSKGEADSVTLPGLGRLSIGTALNGIPVRLLQTKLSASFADRFTIEEVADKPVTPKKTTRSKKRGVQSSD
ncbi:hypothetical protein [Leptothoe spongobia]|uniref:Uncharacterized protein n=1 Tax=Leptothoe spongobia TAU-MAC 1115 TaxID=1967444 RepID=A0A947DFT1_9CYAN|nr:hypothetical protein [Leptothoe spongobia]MBT9316297.1 hypothetical protein [Leptothoe spongobia TAU-MAC 1115]